MIKDFLTYVKGRSFLYLRSVSTNKKITTCDEERERELIGDFVSDVSINNRDNFPKLFEAFLMDIEGDKAHYMIVDELGFAGYQTSPVNNLLKRNIKCKAGTIFFVSMSNYKQGAKAEFMPWVSQAASKNLVDLITQHNEEELDNIYGWMSDRLIEYGKFKDGDKIIERIGETLSDYYKRKGDV
jgi:hypothetical protein